MTVAPPQRASCAASVPTAEDSLDQDRLAGHGAVAEDRAVRGDAGDPEARTDLVADLRRELDSLLVRHDGQLRGGSERTVRLRPVDPDALADAAAVDAFSDGVDDTGTVTVRNDPRERHPAAEPVAAFLDVACVHPGEGDPDAHLAGAGLGLGHLSDPQ